MENILIDQTMRHRFIHAGIVKALLVTIVAVQLVACGGGGGGSGGNASGNHSGSVASSGTSSANSATTNSNTNSNSNTNTNTNTNSNSGTSTSNTSTLTLSWVAPVTRSDGTPLSLADIDGYHIYYGNSPGNYPYQVNVSDGTTQQATLKNLAAGTYYIVMTTYDVSGLESSYSVMVKKTSS
jgi:hypothetical protein